MTGTSPAMSLARPCPSLANFTSAGGHELHPCDVKSSNSTGLCCAPVAGFLAILLPGCASSASRRPVVLFFFMTFIFTLFSRTSSLLSTFALPKQQQQKSLMPSLSSTGFSCLPVFLISSSSFEPLFIISYSLFFFELDVVFPEFNSANRNEQCCHK